MQLTPSSPLAMALGIASLALLAGCPSTLYGGPADLPASVGPLSSDHYYSYTVVIGEGSRTPMGVDDLEVACGDPQVCVATVKNDDTDAEWPVLEVVGVGVGRTTLSISYLHPVTRVRERQTVPVEFIEAPALTRLSVGNALAPPSHPMLFESHSSGGTPQSMLCNRLTGGGLKGGVIGEASARIYACSPAQQMRDFGPRFRSCERLCSVLETFNVCAETRAGQVVAISAYRWDRKTSQYKLVETIGEHSAATCTLK